MEKKKEEEEIPTLGNFSIQTRRAETAQGVKRSALQRKDARASSGFALWRVVVVGNRSDPDPTL